MRLNDTITIGRLFGIRFAVSFSWFIIFFLVAFSLGTGYFPTQYPAWPAALALLAGAAASLLFFGCVLLHELAHSIVAIHNKIAVRSITLFLFGGVSHISADAPTPRIEFAIALAGPLASLAMAALLGAASLVLGGERDLIGGLCFWLAGVNLTLGVFNLVPGFPLDGGRLLRALVWLAADDFRWATRVATGAGQLASLTLVAAGIYLVVGTRFTLNGVWIALIGWFLFNSASANYQGMVVLQLLDRLRVSDVMRPDPPVIDANTSLETLAEELLNNPSRDPQVVVREGQVVGLVGHRELRRLGVARFRTMSVGDAMVRLQPTQIFDPQGPAAKALQVLLEGALEALPVVEDGKIVGLIRSDDLMRVIEIRRRLGR